MARWVLDPADVDTFETSSRASGRRRAALSRALDASAHLVRLTHRPTGVEVSGEIPQGNYSRTEMTQLRQELHARLLAELEQRVARHLRVPGRSPPGAGMLKEPAEGAEPGRREAASERRRTTERVGATSSASLMRRAAETRDTSERPRRYAVAAAART
jgi:hypothetical protein